MGGDSKIRGRDYPQTVQPQGSYVVEVFNRFPLIINDVPPPHPPLIINIPGGQKIFIIRGEYLLKGFGRAAFKFLLNSIKIK